MELYKEILGYILADSRIEVEIKKLTGDVSAVIDNISYKLLLQIREIMRDDSEDEECFEKIERIIEVFENIGIHCGSRHDF